MGAHCPARVPWPHRRTFASWPHAPRSWGSTTYGPATTSSTPLRSTPFTHIHPRGLSTFDPGQTVCEPLSALSYLAGCTRRIKLGTHVLVLPYRDPLLTAKIVSTIDYLSGGRVILGNWCGVDGRGVQGPGPGHLHQSRRGDRRRHSHL